MTDDLVKFHGGPMDGESIRLPSEPGGPPELLRITPQAQTADFRAFDGPPRPAAAPSVYLRRSATPDQDHAWHYDLEQT